LSKIRTLPIADPLLRTAVLARPARVTPDAESYAVRDAATWALAYARRTMARPRAVRCACSTLYAWDAASYYHLCRRGCRLGWLES
jgi:hypothetical protein